MVEFPECAKCGKRSVSKAEHWEYRGNDGGYYCFECAQKRFKVTGYRDQIACSCGCVGSHICKITHTWR